MIEVVINGVAIKAVAEHYPGFWRRAARGEWEPSTYAVIDQLVTPDTVVLDLGSHVGAIALYAAHRAARVIAVEPDPRSLTMFDANIAANPLIADRVVTIRKAIHPTHGRVVLGSRAEGGDSMSSVVIGRFKTTWEVDTVTPRELAALLPPGQPAFVKMDIERGEYAVVPKADALWRHPHLALLLSVHPELFEGRCAHLCATLGLARLSRALGRYSRSRVDDRVFLFTRR